MKRFPILLAMALLSLQARAEAKRVVVLKVDGLPEDLLERSMNELPWIRHVFVDGGAWVRNFYTRGISLSAPSWSILETGQPGVIRGNAEFDRFIPRVYDYLNFFSFYVGYARSQRVDMPGVEVLDEAGFPFLSDTFAEDGRYESMQLYQRGVRWETLAASLRGKVARPVKDLIDEWQTGFDMSDGIERREEHELIAALADPKIVYLDYFSGDVDHTLHLTNDAASQLSALKRLDATVGRIWTAIEASPLRSATVMAMISDHGMNSTPDVYSQGYNLVRFFNSAAGGGHHVISTRHPLSEFKLRGLDPFVSAVVTPSEESFYLRNRKDWVTAMLDLDGNERASIQLRNSDLNEIQILLEELKGAPRSKEIGEKVLHIVDRNRAQWSRTIGELEEELAALKRAIERRRSIGESRTNDSKSEDARRGMAILESWQKDERGYAEYVRAIQRLLDFKTGDLQNTRLSDPAPKDVLGEPNSISQLASYTVGLSPDGLDFAHVNYFETLADIRVRNVVQKDLGAKPVDFIAARAKDGVFLYGDSRHAALISSRVENGEVRLRYTPVCDLHFTPAEWAPGFPLHLYEDPELRVPGDRRAWLNEWHSEREWFEAVHRTRYSNAVIGLSAYFASWGPDSLPAVFQIADQADWPVLRRFAARLRNSVEPDLLILAGDHWNFDVRGFNPGGNHGSFFRISTHSVFMLAGGGVPAGTRVEEPYDSLSFAPTILALMGRLPEHRYPGPVIGEVIPK